jgi:peptidoglycan/xylan/chitin deacetylase (PgdA/CDA1 family)
MKVKEAYLTIDDGPSDYFIEIIEFLEKNNIPAIFFCRGDKLLEKEEEAIYAIKKGFAIGSHSYQHRYLH